MKKSIEKRVLSRIYGKKRGWVFTPGHFLDLGAYDSVARALKNLCDRSLIRRLARGLYDYPKTHEKLGKLSPSPEDIAQALAGKDNLRIQPSGAYAANILGLTEQVPARIIFLTDGTNRKITVGKQEIILKQTTPKNMATAGRITGLVIHALKYLGKNNVDQSIKNKLSKRLTQKDQAQLVKDIKFAPAWIGDLFRNLSCD